MRSGAALWLLVALVALAPSAGAAAEDPDVAEAMRLMQAGRLFPAEQAARRAVEADPDSATAHLTLGRILVRREKLDEAEPALARAAELDPTIAGIDRKLGIVRQQIGRPRAARASLERALEQQPDDGEAWLHLGLARLELGDAEGAAEAFERASQDPAHRDVALFNLEVARERVARRAQGREGYAKAQKAGGSDSVADRANAQLALPPRARTTEEPEGAGKPWSLHAATGLTYESSVVRVEVDRVDDGGDGAAQFELGGAYEATLPWEVEGEVGYDFYQSLYFDKTDFDFQSHGFHGAVSRELADVDTSAGYSFSLNRLGGEGFLDFHELRLSGGYAFTDWWYGTATPSIRIKRFEQDVDRARDAVGVAVGFLQLFPIGDWSRYLLFGVDFEQEDAEGDPATFDAFDYRGVRTQLAVHLPFEVRGRTVPVDLRYRFIRRDYLNPGGADGGAKRDDRFHAVRGRVEIPLVGPVALRAEYQYRDNRSNLSTVDYDVHEVGVLLRARL